MKNLKKLFAVLGLATVVGSSVMLAGCSSSIEGEYKFQEMRYELNGTTTTQRIGDKVDNVTLTEESIVLILRDDEAIVRSYAEYEGEEETTVMIGTWTKGYDGEIYVSLEKEVLVFQKDGKILKGDFDGATITLKK